MCLFGWALGVPAPSERVLGPHLEATDVTVQLGETEAQQWAPKGTQSLVRARGLSGSNGATPGPLVFWSLP